MRTAHEFPQANITACFLVDGHVGDEHAGDGSITVTDHHCCSRFVGQRLLGRSARSSGNGSGAFNPVHHCSTRAPVRRHAFLETSHNK